MQIINIYQAKTKLSKLIERVSEGEEIIIGKSGKPVAKLVAFKEEKKSRKFGPLKGKIEIPDDFDKGSGEINKLFYGK